MNSPFKSHGVQVLSACLLVGRCQQDQEGTLPCQSQPVLPAHHVLPIPSLGNSSTPATPFNPNFKPDMHHIWQPSPSSTIHGTAYQTKALIPADLQQTVCSTCQICLAKQLLHGRRRQHLQVNISSSGGITSSQVVPQGHLMQHHLCKHLLGRRVHPSLGSPAEPHCPLARPHGLEEVLSLIECIR